MASGSGSAVGRVGWKGGVVWVAVAGAVPHGSGEPETGFRKGHEERQIKSWGGISNSFRYVFFLLGSRWVWPAVCL